MDNNYRNTYTNRSIKGVNLGLLTILVLTLTMITIFLTRHNNPNNFIHCCTYQCKGNKDPTCFSNCFTKSYII